MREVEQKLEERGNRRNEGGRKKRRERRKGAETWREKD